MGLPLITDGDSTPCPNCGSPTLHQEFVEVFFREEDADEGIGVSVQGVNSAMKQSGIEYTPVSVFTSQKRNPSRRRDGVAIQFWCEACPAHPVLHVLQHKGDTIIEWGSRG